MSSTRYWLCGKIGPSASMGYSYGWCACTDRGWALWKPKDFGFDPPEIRPGVYYFAGDEHFPEDWFLFMPEVEREALE